MKFFRLSLALLLLASLVPVACKQSQQPVPVPPDCPCPMPCPCPKDDRHKDDCGKGKCPHGPAPLVKPVMPHCPEAPKVGQDAPDLDVVNWVCLPEGVKSVGMADLKGYVVILQFTANWCGPCQTMTDRLKELSEQYSPKGLALISIHVQDMGRRTLEDYWKQKGCRWPICHDSRGETYRRYGGNGIPRLVVIGRDGKIYDPNPTIDELPTVVRRAWLGLRREEAEAEAETPAELDVSGWQNSKPLTLADLKGKAVLLDFWGGWCGPCCDSVPHVQRLHDTYAKDGLCVIGLHTTKAGKNLATYVEALKITYPVCVDNEDRTVRAYGVERFPRVFLIGRDGKVKWSGHPDRLTDEIVKSELAK